MSEIKTDNLVDMLLHHAAEFKTKAAFHYLDGNVEIGESISFCELEDRAIKLAGYLQSRYPQGSRILLLYPSCINYIVAFFACLFAGMIAVPALPSVGNKRNSRLEAIIDDCHPQAALINASQRQQTLLAAEVSPQLAKLEIICPDRPGKTYGGSWKKPVISKDSLAFLQYTSGSTGTPKGVMVSHGNIFHNEYMLQTAVHSDKDSIAATWLPIHHDMGLIGNLLQAFCLGATCYFMMPVLFLQRPLRWFEMIDRYRVTHSGGPNFAYQLCVDKISPEACRHLDLSCWQVACVGSEPVHPDTLNDFARAFSPVGFSPRALMPVYGLAESTLIVTAKPVSTPPKVLYLDREALGEGRVLPASDESGVAQVSCGANLPGQSMRIVDPDTRAPCLPDRVGEIWLSGPHIAQGYWQRQALNREIFQASTGEEKERFLRTGDLGFIHQNELYIAGRRKDLIVINGVNYYPQDLEKIIEDAVAGIKPAGTAIFAVKARVHERVIAVAEIERRCIRKLNEPEVVRQIRRVVMEECAVFVSEVLLVPPGALPRTSSGKIQRHQARQRYLDNHFPALKRPASTEHF